MGNCGKRTIGWLKPAGQVAVFGAGRDVNLPLINKDLKSIPERSRSWQEGKKEFLPAIAASNPQNFPQERLIAAPVYLQKRAERFGEV
jgi:hypothetical protein